MTDARDHQIPTPTSTVGKSGAIVRPRTSRLAILALGLNIPCFLPPFTIVATILGVAALWRVRRRRDLSGAAIAIAAILLGTLLTVVSSVPWWNFYRITVRAPVEAMRGLERGDIATIRSLLAQDPSAFTDDEIAQVAAELRSRFGTFIDGALQRADAIPRREDLWVLPYEMRFEKATVPALVAVSLGDPASKAPMFALSVFQLIDKEHGDMLIPPRSRTLRRP